MIIGSVTHYQMKKMEEGQCASLTGSHFHDCCIYAILSGILLAPLATLLLSTVLADTPVKNAKLGVFGILFLSAAVAGEELPEDHPTDAGYEIITAGNSTSSNTDEFLNT